MRFPIHPDRWPATAALVILLLCSFPSKGAESGAGEFPPELVNWVPHAGNPVFTGTERDTWDRQIRERGYILREGPVWHLWYTGHNRDRSSQLALGYATSTDGLTWNRHGTNPIFSDRWTEDMMVAKVNDTYYMAAEGSNDIAHFLTSADAIHWTDQGDFDIRQSNGEPLSKGPYGTPTLWIEDGIWYLFYERNDDAIWLAKSTDHRVWKNVQDAPVIRRGPEPYDQFGVALNQVIRYQGRYYGIYHATDRKDWGRWSTNIAVSDDLVHWRKYPKNPIVQDNRSSGIIVRTGEDLRLYTMHPEVCVYFPVGSREAAAQ